MGNEIIDEILKNALIAKENRDNAVKMKEILLDVLKEKPNPIGFQHLAELEKMIYTFNADHVRLIYQGLRETIFTLFEMLNGDLDNFSDEEFIKPQEPAQFLKNFSDVKDQGVYYLQIIKQLPAEDKPLEKLAEYNNSIKNIQTRIDKKRKNAAQNQLKIQKEAKLQELYKKVFPGHVDVRGKHLETIKDVPLTPLTADGSEYEMPDDHKEALVQYAAIEELCEISRQHLAKMSPKKLKTKNAVELKDSLTDMEEWLVSTAKVLETEKQTFQKLRQSVDESEKSVLYYENALQDEIAKNPGLLFINKPNSKPKGQ
jgi:uncharacterized protein YlxW (UPF0749 family)